jgi:hypothetical protein
MPRLPLRGLVPMFVALVLFPLSALAQPLGTTFTYQGRLTEGGGPANGGYDLQFVLFDAATGGTQVGPVVTRDDILVTNGLFTVSLDFGPVFGAAPRFLDIGVRPGASTGPYTPLTPRQEVTPAPSALSAPWAGLAGKPAGFADDVDNDSGGDITGITAGSGLTGGGTSGAVTLGISFAGSGTAVTVPRSDHNHLGQGWTGSSPNTSAFSVQNNGNIGTGIFASSGPGGMGLFGVGHGDFSDGVNGVTFGNIGAGVFGYADFGATNAVEAQSRATAGRAIYGRNLGATGNSIAVEGQTDSASGYGVIGRAAHATGATFGVYGQVASAAGYAGYFFGRTHVTGTLSKGAGSFKIDHPLDPENKYLYHSFVESPDMMNVYNGNVTTDATGESVVQLPEWFDALNRDFRYQLTVVGQFAQAMVARKVEGNRFAIRTDKPHVEVSWQVTGIRKDPFAEKNRIPVEEDKPEAERGSYLHPEAWGVAPTAGLDAKRTPPAVERVRTHR